MSFIRRLQALFEDQGDKYLNTKIWHQDGSLHQDIGHSLLKTAYDFIDKHKLPDASIVDIVITGSLAGFNWTEYSDIDLHIIIDYTKIPAQPELAKSYFDTAKTLWNKQHAIEMCDFEVEIYVQDQKEPHQSPGIYSLLDGQWLKPPSKDDLGPPPAPNQINRKADKITQRINAVEDLMKSGDAIAASQYADELKTYLAKMRTAGLNSSGEMSLENQVFKHLRNQGELERLATLKTQAYDTSLSVKKC